MPYKSVYVNTEVLTTIKGVKIFYTYEDEEFDERLENYFSFYEDGDYPEKDFDVRELKTWMSTQTEDDWDFVTLRKDQKRAIRAAIKSGELVSLAV